MRRLFSFGVIAALLLGSTARVQAQFVVNTLGPAADYTLLALSTSPSVSISGANNQPPVPGGGVGGNVGIAATGNNIFQLSGPAQVTGNVYLAGPSSNFQNSSNATNGGVGGTVFTGGVGPNGTTLSQANTAALNAATTFATAGPNGSSGTSIGAVTTTTTITAANPGGLNVLSTTGINLGNGQTLTLSGPAGTQFVVNVNGNMTFTGPGGVTLTGGLTPADVVFNVENGGTVSTSGGLTNNLVTINGIILDTTGKFQLTPGLVNGEIIGGGQISLASGATVVPAPSSLVLMGLGGLAFVGLVVRSRRLAGCLLSKDRRLSEPRP